jgi:hypothetical protein
MSRKLNLKKPKSLKTWLIPKLRKISIYWRGKNEAFNDAKVRLTVGKFKNGKPKERVLYECAHCAKEGLEGYYERHEVQADHINPVVSVEGFVDWNTYIESLFCSRDGYQILCEYHHDLKTFREDEQRVDKASKT